jgi:hypothetical protein
VRVQGPAQILGAPKADSALSLALPCHLQPAPQSRLRSSLAYPEEPVRQQNQK